jgi:carbamate kinase
MASGYHLVITHGNGPQVGAQLLRSLGAGIGSGSRGDSRRLWRLPSGRDWHLLSQSLQTELFAAGLKVPVVSVVSQTVLRRDDPAML